METWDTFLLLLLFFILFFSQPLSESQIVQRLTADFYNFTCGC